MPHWAVRPELARPRLEVSRHSESWVQSQLAIANLRAALARLQEASVRRVPTRAQLADFVAASGALQEALATYNRVVEQKRLRLTAARAGARGLAEP